ncbi:hypothetical protein MOSE0_J09890 [Monosporozyma servazzii]
MKYSGIILSLFLITSVYATVPQEDDISLQKNAFPWHSSLIIGIQGIYAYFDKASPIWAKVAWWGAFVSEDGGVIDSVNSVWDACLTCKADRRDFTGGACFDESLSAIRSIIRNATILMICWNVPGTINNLMGHEQHKKYIPEDAQTIVIKTIQHSTITLTAFFSILFIPSLTFILIEMLQVSLS